MKLKKEGKETGTQQEKTAAPADGSGTEAAGVDCGDSPVAGKEKAMSTDKTGEQGESAEKHDRNQRLLIGISAAILAMLVIASAFALGYFIGHENGVTGTLVKGGRQGLVSPGGLKGGLKQPVAGGAAGGRIREMIRNGEAELARGDVTSVEGGKVTLQTESGSVTIALTDNTRYLGQGSQGKAPGAPAGAAGEAKKLEKGQKVTVLVQRDSGGNMEALAVRVMGQGPGR